MDRFVFWGLCALLIFAPLAFGGVHVWAYSLLIIGVFALFGLKAMPLLRPMPVDLNWVQTPANWAVLLLLAGIACQASPLPGAMISLVSPQTWADKALVAEIASSAVAEGEYAAFATLAYSLHPLIVQGFKCLAYVAMFFLVLNIAATRRRIDALIYVLIAVGIFESFYGIYQTFSENPAVWWWQSRVGGPGYVSGTFIGSNHFAFYLEILLPLTIGLAISRGKQPKRFVPGLRTGRSVLYRLVGWFAPESPNPQAAFISAAAVLMGLALLLSGSRGGILSMGGGVLVLGILFFFRRRFRTYGLIFLGLCLFIFIYGLQVGLDNTLHKFERTESIDQRLHLVRTVLPIFQDYPLAGVGWGNFPVVYAAYRQPDPELGLQWYKKLYKGYLHNDWFETVAEVGLPGGAVILLALGAYLHRLIRVWRRRRDPYAVGIGAGVIAAVIATALHSLVDFSLQIPANPLTLAAVMAVGYAAVHRKGPSYRETFFYSVRRIPLNRWQAPAVAMAVLFVSGGAIFLSGRHLMAEINCPTEWNSTLNLNWNSYLTDIEKAASINPLNAEYQKKLGLYYAYTSIEDETLRRRFNERSAGHFKRALELNPARADCWYELGRLYSLRRYDTPAFLTRWLPAADRCMDAAVRFAPNAVERTARVANYWIWRSRTLPETAAETETKAEAGAGKAVRTRQDGVRRFQALLRHLLTMDPRRWEWAARRVWTYYPDDAVLLGVAPEDDEELARQLLEWAVVRRTDDV